MPKWIELDTEELNKPSRQTIGGTEAQVLLSPYDVPNSVTSKYDRKKARLTVEFGYVSSEPLIKFALENHYLTLILGRNSARIYGLEIDVAGFKGQLSVADLTPQLLAKATIQALQAFIMKASNPHRRGNYGIVVGLLAEYVPQLFKFGQADL
jgi:hypothetical protein